MPKNKGMIKAKIFKEREVKIITMIAAKINKTKIRVLRVRGPDVSTSKGPTEHGQRHDQGQNLQRDRGQN